MTKHHILFPEALWSTCEKAIWLRSNFTVRLKENVHTDFNRWVEQSRIFRDSSRNNDYEGGYAMPTDPNNFRDEDQKIRSDPSDLRDEIREIKVKLDDNYHRISRARKAREYSKLNDLERTRKVLIRRLSQAREELNSIDTNYHIPKSKYRLPIYNKAH